MIHSDATSDARVTASASSPWSSRFRLLTKARRLWQAFGVRAVFDLVVQRLLEQDPHCLRIRGIRTPVWCRASPVDLWVMYQILGQRELEVSVDHAPRLIIDGGAHVGCATLFFAHRYPSARILSVEPEESNVELLTRNCGTYPQVMVIRGALWPCRSTLYIQNPAARHDSFQVGPTDMGFARPVRGYTIPELMRLARADRIDILKLDIEGAERELFTSGYEEWLPRVGTLMIELHDRFRAGCAEAVYEAARSRGASWYQSGEYVIFRFPVA